jgi:hypothetical protein
MQRVQADTLQHKVDAICNKRRGYSHALCFTQNNDAALVDSACRFLPSPMDDRSKCLFMWFELDLACRPGSRVWQ